MLKANSCLFLFIDSISFCKAHCSSPSMPTWATKVLSGLKIFLIYEMISKPWTWEAVLTSSNHGLFGRITDCVRVIDGDHGVTTQRPISHSSFTYMNDFSSPAIQLAQKRQWLSPAWIWVELGIVQTWTSAHCQPLGRTPSLRFPAARLQCLARHTAWASGDTQHSQRGRRAGIWEQEMDSSALRCFVLLFLLFFFYEMDAI